MVWRGRGKWTEVTTEVKARTGEGGEGQRRVESGDVKNVGAVDLEGNEEEKFR